MKILLSWLREYVPFAGDAGEDLDALAATLAGLGLPVEDVARLGGVPGVVTARVVRTESPADATNVQRVWVSVGDGHDRHVWCGAFNFGPGDVVPLAQIGAEMPDGRTIGRRGILGIDSDGMLCSPRELGLGDDHSGILVLPADAPLGVPYGEAIGRADDVVLDIDDDGDGIPAAERERVFERFVRLDEARARDRGGSGLGLAIVAGVVRSHGGTARVGAAPSGGARVEVRLPSHG